MTRNIFTKKNVHLCHVHFHCSSELWKMFSYHVDVEWETSSAVGGSKFFLLGNFGGNAPRFFKIPGKWQTSLQNEPMWTCQSARFGLYGLGKAIFTFSGNPLTPPKISSKAHCTAVPPPTLPFQLNMVLQLTSEEILPTSGIFSTKTWARLLLKHSKRVMLCL